MCCRAALSAVELLGGVVELKWIAIDAGKCGGAAVKTYYTLKC
jgi:hypothetical protein